MLQARGKKTSTVLVAVVLAALLSGCFSGTSTPAAIVTSSPPEDLGKANNELVIGALLPKSAPLEGLGLQTDVALTLALNDINAAGGVLGRPVRLVRADSGINGQNTIFSSVNGLFDKKIDALVGPMTSSLALSVKPLMLEHKLPMISPAATADALTQLDPVEFHRGQARLPFGASVLIARTVPDDSLLGLTFGNYIHSQEQTEEGSQGALSVLASNDTYGTSVAQGASDAYQTYGQTAHPIHFYDPQNVNVEMLVEQVKKESPTSVLVVGLEETPPIIEGLFQAGYSTTESAHKRIYVAGAPIQGISGIEEGSMEKVVSLRPGAQAPEEFRERLLELSPQLKDFSFSPETYDALIILALAAEAARSDEGQALADQLQTVTRAGVKCTSFAQCKEMLNQDQDIDYEGISGPCDLADDGNLTKALVGQYSYDETSTAHLSAALETHRES